MERVREERAGEKQSEATEWGMKEKGRVCVCGADSRQFWRGPTQTRRPVGQGSAGGKPEPSMRLIENR